MKFSSIAEAIQDLQRGRCIIVVDDEHRENEADLVLSAEKATPTKINFMIKKGGGLVCVPMEGKRLDELKLPLMVPEEENNEITKCKFTVSVDFRHNTTTGISAQDRYETVKALIDKKYSSKDFSRPGHVFPLRYEEGGVLKREGHTEAAIDLCKLAGLYPAAVVCEILNEDGTTAKLPDLEEYSQKHNLRIITIKELISQQEIRRPS